MGTVRGIGPLRSNALSPGYRTNSNPPPVRKNTLVRSKPKTKDDLFDVVLPVISESGVSLSRWSSEHAITDHTDAVDYSSDEDTGIQSTCKKSLTTVVGEDYSVTVYKAFCKKYSCVPLNTVKTGLTESFLSCKFIQLKSNDIKAICYGLCVNCLVDHIEFEQNEMGLAGLNIVNEVIRMSPFITQIRIAENKLQSKGAKYVCEAVKANGRVTLLDLSGNGFVESDGKYFKQLLEGCPSLRELNLSHNNLMVEGIKTIATAVSKSSSLIVLDLSWNHIRLDGAKAIGNALNSSPSIRTLNLAWNGLHMQGAVALSKALRKNDNLEELDLTCNRLSEKCIAELLKGLKKNSTLRTLRISKNQITCAGALAILKDLSDSKKSGITLLDLGTQEVNDKFETVYRQLSDKRDIAVVYGQVLRSDRKSITSIDVCEDEKALLSCNPLTVLMECMRLQNLRLVDFFNSFDSDKSNLISIDELCDGMLKLKVPIARITLMKLLNSLDKDGNKMLDFSEMVEAQNEYKKRWRQSLAGHAQLDESEIGRVSKHIRRIAGKKYVMKKEESDSLVNLGPLKSRSRKTRVKVDKQL